MLLHQYLLHYGLLLHIMSQYLCLFSLILQGLHEEGECRQLEFWLEKEQILETYSAQLQKSWNFTEVLFGINKKYWAEKVPEGGHTLAMRVEGAPYPLGAPPPSWLVGGPPLVVYSPNIFYIFWNWIPWSFRTFGVVQNRSLRFAPFWSRILAAGILPLHVNLVK